MSVSSKALFIAISTQGDGPTITHRILGDLIHQLGLVAKHPPERVILEGTKRMPAAGTLAGDVPMRPR